MKVYRSYSDWVLALAFPVGELPHRPFPEGWSGATRTAIGRHGCGRKFDNVEEEERFCGHSGYWRDSTISAAIREELQQRAGSSALRVLSPRVIASRNVQPRAVGDPL